MIYIHRLIISIFLFSFSSSSFALINKSTFYRYSDMSAKISDYIYDSSSEACQGFLETFTNPANTYSIAVQTETTCGIKSVRISDGYSGNNIGAIISFISSCPENSVISGEGCACNEPFIENSTKTACIAAECKEGSLTYKAGVVPGRLNPYDSCVNGCIVHVAPDLFGSPSAYISEPPPGQSYAVWMLRPKALSCDGNTSDYPSLPTLSDDDTTSSTVDRPPELVCKEDEQKVYTATAIPTCAPKSEDSFCPVGYTYGTINGVDSCVNSGTGEATVKAPSTTTTSETTETTNPDGSTTKTTTKTSSDGTGEVTTVTTSADGKTVTTESQIIESKDKTKSQDDSNLGVITDTSFSDVPVLYEKKYPSGLQGVWDTKITLIKNTPLFSLPSNLMPSISSSGSCPSWTIDFSFSGFSSLGSYEISPPCWVWDFGKAVIIISSLLLARRLIFGG